MIIFYDLRCDYSDYFKSLVELVEGDRLQKR